MDVEKTIEFLLQSHAQQEANLGSLTGSMRELTSVVRELALAQVRTEERVQELTLLQREHSDVVRELALAQVRTEERVQELAVLQRDHSESLKQTRENLDALIRVVDELARRNGRH